MQLVDIVEPELSECAEAFGIDLGTTNSLVAKVEDSGEVRVFCDVSGRCLVPSVVEYCGGGDIKVGDIEGSPYAIRSIKRLVGRCPSCIRSEFSGVVVNRDGGAGVVLDVSGYGQITPVEVSADILRYLSAIVKNNTGEGIKRAVITVPAYFDEVARKATRDAANLAGIEVMRLLNEPTAAALAYEQIAEGDVCVVYDLGGGTFDVSVVKMHGGVLQIIATGGDVNLGGDDIDRILCELVLKKYKSKHCIVEDLVPSASLLLDARKAKERLSESGQDVNCSFAIGKDIFSCNIGREEFSGIVDDIIARTAGIIQDTLMNAGISYSEVERVILVGGSSKIPHVKVALREMFGDKVYCDIDPERAVVTGAALQAYYLSNPEAIRSKGKLLVDIVPLSLSLETIGGVCEVIIPRNTPVPALATQEFTTYVDGQTLISIHVCQGEREIASENRTLVKFDLRVPPLPAGEVRIRVEFKVDMDGLLTVSAWDADTGSVKSVEINSTSQLTMFEIERQVLDSVENFDSDMAARELNTVIAECTSIAETMRDILQCDEHLPEHDRNIAHDILLLSEEIVQANDVKKMRDFIRKVNGKIADLKKKKSGVLCGKQG
ncbi:MAG: Hsp70 family protein [Aaplasma endosymbiont of Hyalomma asiaticum]